MDKKLCFIICGDLIYLERSASKIALPERVPSRWQNDITYERAITLSNETVRATVTELAENVVINTAEFIDLRSLYYHVSEVEWKLAGRAMQVIRWNRDHQYCSRCGSRMGESESELAKVCPDCSLVSYPRLSPAVIMSIVDGERILLARSAHFPEGMYAPLAGFVEPGETMEEAVVREINEEVGLTVTDITYLGNQPWPFPHSMMVAFTTRFAGGKLQIDNTEIEDAAWFTRTQLPPKLPSRMSISRRLINHFLKKD